MAGGGAWTLALPSRRYNVVLKLWESWRLLGIISGPVQRLFTYLGSPVFCDTGASRQEFPFHLPEYHLSTEGTATSKVNCGLAENSRRPFTSWADKRAFQDDMRAWSSHKKRERPHRTQTTTASDISRGSPGEGSVSPRDSGVEKAPAAPVVDEPVAQTSMRDEARSISSGRRPSNQTISDPLGIFQALSTRDQALDAEAAGSQPGCPVSEGHEACTVWPRPLLEDAEEPSETTAPSSIGFFPFFGARNILNFTKRDSTRKLFSRKSVEDPSQSEAEAIELDVLKWETYESPREEPQQRKCESSAVFSEAKTRLTTDGSSQTPCSDVSQKMTPYSLHDTTARDLPPTDSFVLEMDLVRLTNEIAPHSPTDVEVEKYPDEDDSGKDHGLWSTLFDGRTRRLSHNAMSADDIEIDEKVAAWDPSQENSYALQSPGELELFDIEIADPRDRQASQKPTRFQACNERAVNHTLSQPRKDALPSATADHGLYEDLKWMTEESEKSENEPISKILAERLFQRCPKRRFGRMPPKRISKVAAAVTSVSSYVDLKSPPKRGESPENQHVPFLSTSSAPSTSRTWFPREKSVAENQSPQETTEEFSVGSFSPPYGQSEERQPEVVEPSNAAGAPTLESTGMRSKAECADDAPEASGSGVSGVPRADGLAPRVRDVAKTEDEGLLDQAALRTSSKRRKKRRKHRKKSKRHQRRRLAKIKKKEQEAASARRETHVESKNESPGTIGTPAVRKVIPHPNTEFPLEWGVSCSLSGVGCRLCESEFQDDEVQRQDTGSVTIRIRTSTRTKASMVWPFGPPPQ